ncbi:MAG: hypothetical protein CMJ78_01565 [Planctomycetaceae bacterium]|nr:hypothetical protein [Planctomycetaceae bacterium]
MSTAITTLVAIPLVGYIATAGFVAFRPRSSQAGVSPLVIAHGLAFVAWVGAYVLLRLPELAPQYTFSLPIFDYLHLGGVNSLKLALGIQVDPMNAVWLLTSAGITLLISIVGNKESQRDVSLDTALLLHCLCNGLLLLAADLGQLLIFWIATSITAHFLCQQSRPTILGERSSTINVSFAVHRLADLALAYGIFLIWSEFGTLDIFAIQTPQRMQSVMDAQPSSLETVVFLIAVASASRLGLFPLHLASDAIDSANQRTRLLCQAATLMPSAIFLLVRFSPMMAISIQTRSLIAMFCGLSLFLTAAIAVAQKRRPQVIAAALASNYALMIIGIMTGYLAGVQVALFLLVSVQVGVCLITLPRLTIERSRITKLSTIIGAAILTTTLWGQGAVLSTVWKTANLSLSLSMLANPRVMNSDPSQPFLSADRELSVRQMAEVIATREFQSTLTLTYWLAMAGMFLVSIAWVRVFYRWPEFNRNVLTSDTDEKNPTWSGAYIAGAALLVVGAAINFATADSLTSQLFDDMIPPVLLKRLPSSVGNVVYSHWNYLLDTVALPVGLIGALIAWILYSKQSDLPAKVEQLLGPFARLSQHRFYFAEIYEYGLMWPTRVLSLCCRGLDRWFFGSLVNWLPLRFPVWSDSAIRPLQTKSLVFYSISTIIGFSVLCVALLMMK